MKEIDVNDEMTIVRGEEEEDMPHQRQIDWDEGKEMSLLIMPRLFKWNTVGSRNRQ